MTHPDSQLGNGSAETFWTWDEYFMAVRKFHIFAYGGYATRDNRPVTQEDIDSVREEEVAGNGRMTEAD